VRSATRVTVAAFGVIAGLAGVEHGVGEVLQGNVALPATAFRSWPDSEFFAIQNGEPALSLVPNMLATGLLAILASLVFLVWATVFAGRRHGGGVLVLLSVSMLVVGGGFGPPILGVILGLVATKIGSPLPWWRERVSPEARRALGALWPWSLAAGVLAWLMVSPGIPLLAYLLGTSPLVETLLLVTIPTALGLLLLAALTGLARDAERPADAPIHQPRSGMRAIAER
jgi:hypothetical protein